MFLPIKPSDWICPGCGCRREMLGELGMRKLRCPRCEGEDGPFMGTGAQSRDQGRLGRAQEAESVRNSGSLIPLGLAQNGTVFVPQ